MNEQICQVLGLDAHFWPPDHYTLLGLKRGESDQKIIEQRVHERMGQLRPYQLTYPDQATEAMNRLAQAYGCLTDSAARKAYDESLLSPPPPASPGGVLQGTARERGPAPADKKSDPRIENGPLDPKDPLAWLFGPWDRLADPLSADASGARPHFRDWVAMAPPPQRRRSVSANQDAQIQAVSPEPPSFGKPENRASPRSFFWKHSGILLIVMSSLALLAAVWRTFRL
jgi:hypothetical protein